MKKRNFACLALALPLFAFAGCAGATPRLALSANWYAATNTTNSITDTYEKLEYEVTFESAGSDAYSVSYDTGTYTTELEDVNVTVGDEVKPAYHLTTELRITGRFTVNGETGANFTDVVTSEVWFLDVTTELQPIRSVKKVLSHSPYATGTPGSVENACITYEYTYTTEYNADCTQATITIEYAQPEELETVEKVVSLSGDGSFLDNETILFAMRGVSTSSAASFRTINPVTQQQSGIGMSAAPSVTERSPEFSVNGAESAAHKMNIYTFSLSYSGNNSGQAQEFAYAAKTDGSTNTYRNVLLEMSVPVLGSLGTLTYKLKSATFNNK